MKQEDLENLWDTIQNLPNDPDYTPIPNMPIPLGKSVIVKKVKQTVLQLGGIILPDTAENSQLPHVGIIYAVGPGCTKGVRAGLRCYHNVYADLSIRINGQEFLFMEEMSVYYILRSNEQFIDEGVKSEKEVRREKKFEEQASREIRIHAHEQNEKDKKLDKTKGKVHSMIILPKK